MKFIDLFAGIGGFRLGFERAGATCVFTSEWDKWAQKTYKANHGEHEVHGDIRNISANDIPDHDIPVAGFPCQPFSISGVSKKNSLGHKHGFECETQGTLFFEIERILAHKRPKAFLLENVKNLQSHDKGNTFRVIRRTLSEKLGYDVSFKIIDAKHFSPHHRERIFIAGYRSDLGRGFDFNKVMIPDVNPKLKEILQHDSEISPRHTLSEKLWAWHKAHAAKHKSFGNGFGFGLVGPNDIARTLSSRYHKDGAEILIHQEGKPPRMLTPRECARLMGFPDSFQIVVSNTQAYRQFGNSVAVPVVESIAKAMIDDLK